MLPHQEPPVAFFCMAAADAVDAEEEDNWCAVATATICVDKEEDKFGGYSAGEGGENLASDFNDLVGAKTSGLDNHNYSSDDDDNDNYHYEIKDKERIIEYFDVKKVTRGQRQTNIICGGPQPPDYLGMNSAKLVEAKKEYEMERKKYSDSLRMKHLNKQNKGFEPDSFTRCLSFSL